MTHVAFMAAPLAKLASAVTVDLPLLDLEAANKPIQKWAHQEVTAW